MVKNRHKDRNQIDSILGDLEALFEKSSWVRRCSSNHFSKSRMLHVVGRSALVAFLERNGIKEENLSVLCRRGVLQSFDSEQYFALSSEITKQRNIVS